MKKRILAIPGSTRQQSSNKDLIKAIGLLFEEELELTLFEGIADLPHFNPDLVEHTPAEVLAFKKQIADAEGVIICTPEYAMGLPGSLKNAIDWTVASCEFSQKPVALITAATSGEKAHESLLGTLRVIEAKVDGHHLLIQFIKTKINSDYQIVHEQTLADIRQLMHHFMATINEAAVTS